MKKNKKMLISITLFILIVIVFWVVFNLKQLSNLDIFNIEEN